MKLSTKVTLNNDIQIACLPSQKSNSYPNPTPKSYAAGWGTLSSGGSAPSTLNNVLLNIYPSSSCNTISQSYKTDWNTQICAGDLSGNKDTCQGNYILLNALNYYFIFLFKR
jgi:hypothetical protein